MTQRSLVADTLVGDLLLHHDRLLPSPLLHGDWMAGPSVRLV